MTTRFDHVISLGSDCDVSLQLRRRGWLRTPSLFDWLVTPWQAMVAVLRDNGSGLVRDLFISLDGKGVTCAFYGLTYWHEFPRTAQQIPIVTNAQVVCTRDKLRHKLDSMNSVCRQAGCVLFIRSGIATNSALDDVAESGGITGQSLNALAALIETLYPGLRFSVLLVRYPGHDVPIVSAPNDPRILITELPFAEGVATPLMTRATDADWDRLFDQVPYSAPAGAVQQRETHAYTG